MVQQIVQHNRESSASAPDSGSATTLRPFSAPLHPLIEGFHRKFTLLICELHNKHMHGFTEESDPNVQGHYLVVHDSTNHSIFRPPATNADGEYVDSANDSDSDADIENHSENDRYFDNIYGIIQYYRHKYYDLLEDFNVPHNVFGPNKEHPLIRNYYNIITDVDNYLKPEIGLKLYLSGGECVAILKTFWLRIIQRTWKKVYSKRVACLNRRIRISSLNHRTMTGRWPDDCLVLPTIHGMLYNLV